QQRLVGVRQRAERGDVDAAGGRQRGVLGGTADVHLEQRSRAHQLGAQRQRLAQRCGQAAGEIRQPRCRDGARQVGGELAAGSSREIVEVGATGQGEAAAGGLVG